MTKTLLMKEELFKRATRVPTIDTNPILSTSKLFTSRLKCVILAFFIFIGVGNVWGQFTGAYNFTTGDNVNSFNYNGSVISNLTVSAITKNGITTSSSAGNFRASAWTTGSTNGGAAGGTIDLTDYFEFTITAAAGYTISNPSLSFGVGRSATGPRRFQWRWSVDSYGSALSVGTVNASITHSSGVLETPDANSGYTGNAISATTSGQTSITFRFYAYGAESSGGTGGLHGALTFGGTLVASATSPSLTSPTVSSITTTSATLGATVSSNGGAALSARGTVWGTSASPSGNALAEGSTTVAAFTHSRTGLTANTAYTYRGYATNSAGTGYSTDGTFTTLPLAPTVGTGNSTTASGFTANWSHPTMGSASYSYTVEVDDNNDFSSIVTTVNTISSSNTSQAISGLAASTTYYYRVKAVNAEGPSDWSSISAGVTTSSAASPTLSAATLSSALSTTYGTPSIGVSFTASGSNLTGDITATAQSGYEVSTNNSSFSNSVDVASGTAVYVRFSATQTAGSYNGATAVVLTSSGATAQNVTTSGSGNEVSKATPSINSSPTATAITYGQTLASSTLSGGSASVVGSFAFTTPSAVPNGGTANQSVTFTPIDNANYNTTTTNVSVTVNKADQTISFGALANKTTTDPAFSLTATASSGLAVSYSSSNTAVATIVGSTVTIQGAGTTTITASQAGDGNYNAATSVVQTLTVTQAPQGIFTEDMRTPSATTSIASHTFQNSPTFTYTNGGATNSADVRNTSPSSGYTGASGNGNVFFTSTSGNYGFAIEGIDASTYTNLEVRFAYRKENATVLPNFTLDYWNGSSYVNLPFSFNESANAAIGWYFVNWIALPSGAQISSLRLRWVKAGGQSVRLDDVTLRGIISTSPLILVSQNSLSGFSQNSSTPSAEQSYTVSGDNLTNDVTITPPTGFEISTSTGGSFSATNPITLTASGGNLVGEPVTIYVRQSASTLGSVSGNIAHSSTGSNNPNVAVSGTRTGSFYSKSSGNLDEVGTWGINTDGSGSSPSNFSSDGIVYEIRNRTTATIGANWTITGTASKVLVGDGTNATDFTIPSNYTLTGTIDVSTNAELTIENTTSPTLGTLASNSTLEYNNLAVTLSTAVTYRNLKLTGTGAKTFPGGTTTITGNLIFDNCVINGGSGPFSTILLAGNLTYSGAVTSPADANSITLSTNGTASGTQTITGAGNTLRWFRVQTTTANSILLSTTGGSSNLLLGNASGGGLTLINGSVLNMNGNDFTLFSSTSTSAAFVLNSTGSISATSATDFTLQRTGNGNLGTIRFSDGANTIGSLTLNHTGSANNRLYLGSTLTIANNLVLTAGKLDILGNTLTIGTASNVGTISGTFNNNNYIVAYDNGSGAIGKVQRYVHPTSNTSYSFPIGDNLKYAPITYTNTGGTAAAGAYLLVHTKPSKIPQLNSNITNYLNRYWEVEPMGITSPDYSIQFSYESTDIVGPTNSAFIPIKYSNTTWYRPTNTLNTSGTAQGTQVNAGANSLQWDDLTSFSQFSAVADQATALPIELVSFQANCKADNTVSVTWTTASEHNTSHYVVEKSRDGINWSVLGQTAAAGNSTQLLNYEMIDSEKASGTTYYRLTQFDNDGEFEVFDPVSVNCNGATSNNHITTYPNPSFEGFYVSFFTETMEGNGQLTITDASGRPVYGMSVNIQDGNNVFHIGDLNAAPGMYYIQVSNGTTTTDIVKHSLR